MFAHALPRLPGSLTLQRAGPGLGVPAAAIHGSHTPCWLVVSGGYRYSRRFATDFPLVPLLAVGEVLLVGTNELLYSTYVGAENKSSHVNKMVSTSTPSPCPPHPVGPPRSLELPDHSRNGEDTVLLVLVPGGGLAVDTGLPDLDFQQPLGVTHQIKNCPSRAHTQT